MFVWPNIEGNAIADKFTKKSAYLEQDAASNIPVPFNEVKKTQ